MMSSAAPMPNIRSHEGVTVHLHHIVEAPHLDDQQGACERSFEELGVVDSKLTEVGRTVEAMGNERQLLQHRD